MTLLKCCTHWEKGMATHSSILAWRIPRTEEAGRLHTYSPWDRKESDTTEQLTYTHTQYVSSKFEKLSSGHRTGKGQFSFQSQRKAMQKNVQTIVQLWSFRILVRLWSKSSKLGVREPRTFRCTRWI